MGEVALEGTPNPRQREFFVSTARHIGYGGARGGGKSWAMRRKFVLLCLNYPYFNALLLRRTFPELRENHVIPLLKELNGIAKYRGEEKVFLFPNGSRLKLGYCEHEQDVYQYQGQEYDVIGLEEATMFTESQMQFLTTCNRSTRTDFSPRMYYTANPGGVGHAWFKRLFIDREYRELEQTDDYVFIPAKVYDNKVLMTTNPGYVDTLKNLPEDLRRAHLEGDWDVFVGQFFREFSREKHVVAPFELPSHWRRFRSLDWGFNDYSAVYWHAIAPDKRVYTYRELYVNQTLASDLAEKIKELSKDEQVVYTVASPDMWQKRGGGYVKGESIADTFHQRGVYLRKADNNRVIGWQRCREFMATAPDGLPYWQIFENCANLIRTIPALIYDEHDSEDVDDSCEDHSMESARYALMSRPRPNPEEKLTISGTYAVGELRMMGYSDHQIRKLADKVKIIGGRR